MAQKAKSSMNTSKIIGIQFSVLSPEEIRKGSVAEITSRDTYINNPNNKRFIKIEILPSTNWSCLLLYKKIATQVQKAESKNNKEIPFNNKESSLKRSITKVVCSGVFHKLKTKINRRLPSI